MQKIVVVEGSEPTVVDMTPEEAEQILAFASPPPPRIVTSLEFLELFTDAERKALRRAAKVNEDLEDFLDLLRAAQVVDLDDPRTVMGIAAFVQAGLITEERALEVLQVDTLPWPTASSSQSSTPPSTEQASNTATTSP